MGAAGSTIKLEHLSANDIGRLVAGLGEKYISYEVLIVENGISGEVLTSLNGGEMKEILVSIGVSNVAHQTILITHFKRLKGEASGAGGGGGGVGNNSGGEAAVNPGGCVFHALPSGFSVGEQVTKSPRAIMSKLFEIQGIAVDPSDLDPAIEKIAKAVGGGFGDGVNKYDCFINYRVAADADLAEKLYLYLKTKGIHAFLDKKCLKNGEKWKDGFLAGLKNSKCFVALISKKALDRVRDKECDHTWDNVLLEYETALNIMQVTENPKYICPLHLGECNGGILSKFQDFNPSLYPDSVTAIIEEKVPQIPKAAPLVSETNDEDNEAPEEEAEEANIDDNEEAQENDGEIGLIICNVCDQGVYKHPSGTWHDGWGCDWPGHEGENFNFTANDPVYGCSTILECNWGVCETCYQNYIVEKANEKENEAGNVFNVPQPEGTRSSYSGSNQYYCEVKNVRFEASTDGDDGVLVIEYNVRGDMSLGPLQDPSSSKILCGVKSFSPVSIKVYFKDAFQNCGELVYHISEADQDSFMSESVRFVFGKSGYSEAKLVMPNASLENQNVQLPLCSSGEHIMIMSDYHEGRYAGGFGCDICGEAKQGFRWFCEECQSDKCFSCEPMQVLPAAKCGCTDHSLERCSGNKYGSRNCDVCKRRQLQYDPEYYHCVLNCVKGGYDLCLTCASKQQAEFQAESQL